MKHGTILIPFSIILAALMTANATPNRVVDIKSAVVRIDVVKQKPDYNSPWKMQSETYGYGSGCIIDGNRILTNAHIVADHKYIQVQKAGYTAKYTAEVEFIAHDCDLALLKVKDKDFFRSVFSLKLGGIPTEGDRVTAYGFPVGGDKISITQGVVSRIDMKQYSHSGHKFIVVQIDAAINVGNSGGPVLQKDKLTGIAFQGLKNGEKAGYMIPGPVIKRFFDDIQDGKYDGFPSIECGFQPIENQAMRSILKLKENQTGVYITSTEFGNTLWGVLRKGDVLLSVGGVSIANDGTIEFVNNDSIDFRYLMSKHQVGDEMELVFIREGKILKRSARLLPEKRLAPFPQYDVKPSYFIFSGLVFIPLTCDYIHTWEDTNPPIDLFYNYVYGILEEERSQVVLLSKVMAHEVNQGYHEISNSIVLKVNGNTIGSMADLSPAFKKPEGSYHIVELEDGLKIILSATEAEKSHGEILINYNIPKDRSDDLK